MDHALRPLRPGAAGRQPRRHAADQSPGITTDGRVLSVWPPITCAAPGCGRGTFSEFLAVAGDPYLTADLLPAVRFPTALLAAACVAVAYFLLRRTFGRTVSTLAAALIALDPFFITYARVLHHDALASMFVLVAVLALVTYLVAEPRTLYAGIAGIATGLAWLSKASTLFLGPFGLALFVIVFLARTARSGRGMRVPWSAALRGLLVWAPSRASRSRPMARPVDHPARRRPDSVWCFGRAGRIRPPAVLPRRESRPTLGRCSTRSSSRSVLRRSRWPGSACRCYYLVLAPASVRHRAAGTTSPDGSALPWRCSGCSH